MRLFASADNSINLHSFPIIRLFFDCGSIGTIAEAKENRDDEEGFDVKHVPNPAAKQCNENGDEVINRDAGGDGVFTTVHIAFLPNGRLSY